MDWTSHFSCFWTFLYFFDPVPQCVSLKVSWLTLAPFGSILVAFGTLWAPFWINSVSKPLPFRTQVRGTPAEKRRHPLRRNSEVWDERECCLFNIYLSIYLSIYLAIYRCISRWITTAYLSHSASPTFCIAAAT